jgi:L-fucose isomerase-like protein
LMLIAHGSDNGTYALDFTAQLKTATTALQSVGTGTSTSGLADVAARLRAWTVADGQVRTAVTAGDYDSAVAIALGTGSTDAAHIAADLNAEMTGAQRAFADDSNSAGSALDGLPAGLVAAGILAAIAAGYGVNRRLAEYR